MAEKTKLQKQRNAIQEEVDQIIKKAIVVKRYKEINYPLMQYQIDNIASAILDWHNSKQLTEKELRVKLNGYSLNRDFHLFKNDLISVYQFQAP